MVSPDNAGRRHAAVAVGDRQVGAGQPCYVIAEAGVNHNGSVDRAHELVDTAATAGADAVKFQTFAPSSLVTEAADAAPYQEARGADSQLSMLRSLVLPEGSWAELASHASERGLDFLSTAFDAASLETVLELGPPALKVPSGELDNLVFIEQLASHGLPLIISTGLGSLEEVESAVAAASDAPGVVVLHCVTAYPAPIESSNLRAIQTLGRYLGVPVGWSDHTEGSLTAIIAVALGATLVEKHLTTDRELPGPDHGASASPEEFATLVSSIRATETALGDGIKMPRPSEQLNRVHARRSYHATRDLSIGTTLADGDLVLLRPADGLPPGSDVIGQKIAREVARGAPITQDDLA